MLRGGDFEGALCSHTKVDDLITKELVM
jgi:hypothetical protein